MLKQRLNLVGSKFNKLTVTEFAGLDARRNSRWLCRCECGKTVTHTGCNLKKGTLKTCGCEQHKKRVATRVEDHPDFSVFSGMLARCYTPGDPTYQRYGARGIKVCDRWREGGFWVFLGDMGPRPTPDHSIDRYPDTNGDYTPENCRWATPKQQANNRRTNKLLTYRGETKTMKEWADVLGINYQTLKARCRRGWLIEDMMTAESCSLSLPTSVVQEIESSRGEGVVAIARRLGVGHATVSRILAGKR